MLACDPRNSPVIASAWLWPLQQKERRWKPGLSKGSSIWVVARATIRSSMSAHAKVRFPWPEPFGMLMRRTGPCSYLKARYVGQHTPVALGSVCIFGKRHDGDDLVQVAERFGFAPEHHVLQA
jgi:hypothetical protein